MLVIAIVAMLGPGLGNLYIAITLVSWVPMRESCAVETLALKTSRICARGARPRLRHARIMFRHVLPNAIAPAFVFAMSDFVLDVQLGATLSFFGLGVQPPTPEWG